MATDKKIPSNLVFSKEKFRYNTVQDVINDTGLTVGLVVETDGYNTLGDGFDAKYLITNVNEQGSILLKNGNYAKEISNSNGSKKLNKVNTIEELKSQNLKVGDIVEVLGYYTAGDGAGHKRKIEDADDGSGVQLDNRKWANIVHNGEINIKWLGAKGDGVTDDTNSFKTQFNLFIPVGTFLINNTIKMQSGNHLRGENMYDSIIKVGSDVDGIWVNTDCTLENLAFDSDLEIYNSDVLRIGDETFTQMPKNGSMCGVNINNISSNFKCSQGNSILFHILSSGYNENGNLFLPKTEGYWGLKINHIRYRGYFNRVFKIESKIWNKTVAPPWLTYSSVSDVKGIYAITGIEGVATFETGNYETSKITPAINIKFENCNFESGKKTEYGIISDGIQLDLYEVVFGDFQDGLPGYKIYKINYYPKLFNYGTFIVYDNYFNKKDLENIYFDIANFYGDIQDFIFGHINIKVKNISSKNNVSIDKNSLISSMNEYVMVKKNLLWICRYNKNNILNISSKSNSYINFSLNYLGIKDSVFTDMYKANFVYNINFPETAMQVLINSPKVPEFVYEENENFLNIGIVYKPEDKNSVLPINSFFSLGSMPNINLRLLYLSTAIEIEEEYYLTLKKCKITQTLEQLSTPYMAEKMKQENVYDDYITYMDEKTLYDKKQRKLEKPQPSEALKKFMDKYL